MHLTNSSKRRKKNCKIVIIQSKPQHRKKQNKIIAGRSPAAHQTLFQTVNHQTIFKTANTWWLLININGPGFWAMWPLRTTTSIFVHLERRLKESKTNFGTCKFFQIIPHILTINQNFFDDPFREWKFLLQKKIKILTSPKKYNGQAKHTITAFNNMAQ